MNNELKDEDKEFDLKKLKWRMLSLLDIKKFKEAAIESIESNYEFLGYGPLFENITPSEYLATYYEMLYQDPMDHFGVFDKGKLLGHIAFTQGFGQFGIETIGWVRNGYHNKGLGEYGLAVAEVIAFERKKFNFISLHIDQRNVPSRKAAEKAGFKPVLKLAHKIGQEECSILYLKINPRIQRLARQFGRRAIDVMNSPAGMAGMAHYLLSDSVVEFYAWPFGQFDEKAPPVNAWAFDDFVVRISLSPKILDAQKYLDEQEKRLA
jgi:RimJ/RimL family protein N-acetyltransferase